VAQTMRERVQLHRHVRALSAEGRMSAYILGVVNSAAFKMVKPEPATQTTDGSSRD